MTAAPPDRYNGHLQTVPGTRRTAICQSTIGADVLFNSTRFLVFFVLVYGLYLLGRRHHRFQNRMLLVASYVFYGAWDWRFLGLLLLSTAVDYGVGLRLGSTAAPRQRKALLAFSLAVNLGILAIFKYFGFFVGSLVPLLRAVGLPASDVTLHIVLPVGISFYTFQTLSYTFDIYRGTLAPTRDPLDFALFVAFFPQLVAGPIERAASLLPRITAPRRIDAGQVNAGVFLLLWGYFKKVAIADNVGVVANQVFNHYGAHAGGEVLLGVLAFTIQIYCDFSGYSDIARGLAKLMGFDLMVNFRLPYAATDPSDFWARWHVSLSSWLRDYLYVPLGGNRKGGRRTSANLLTTMVLGGLWHGAAWNFVIWGGYHGLLLIGYRVWGRRAPSGTLSRAGRRLLMFGFTLVGWVIFRAASVHQIVHMLGSIGLGLSERGLGYARIVGAAAVPLVLMQVYQERNGDLLAPTRLPAAVRVPLYGAILAGTLAFAATKPMQFIYFQF